jgi:hypothetical protein
VDLHKVPIAAITAALPRLHTLEAYQYAYRYPSTESVPVSAFFTDLLPRLRVFQFKGYWPLLPSETDVAPPDRAAASATAPPPPLPLLEELTWWESGTTQPALVHRFLGARPVLLRGTYEMIAQGLSAQGGVPEEPASNILARVCELHVLTGIASVNVSDVARVLRAAPRLRTFRTNEQLCGDTAWLTASTAPLHPAFVGVVHPRLRCFAVNTVEPPPGSPLGDFDEGCASRLRRTCFPRLRELEVDDDTFFRDAWCDLTKKRPIGGPKKTRHMTHPDAIRLRIGFCRRAAEVAAAAAVTGWDTCPPLE